MQDGTNTPASYDCAGTIRTTPDDFRVDEIPAFKPSGQGEHVWLKIRKTGENTDWVAGNLARIAGVKRRDVGFAGLKDRHAVTTQWFSVWLPGKEAPDWQSELPDSVVLLNESRHDRKLRRGALKGNRFQIRVRDLSCRDDAISLLSGFREMIQREGIPNYFGVQRFGREGHNVDMAKQLFAGKLKVKNRQKRGLYLSAARSWLFNQVLQERESNNSWREGLPGDLFMLEGSNAFFQEEYSADIRARLANQDIHPTGMLWGRGKLPTTDQALAIESKVAAQNADLCEGLEKSGLKQERRALRCRVADFDYTYTDWNTSTGDSQSATVDLTFSLPPGSYATVLLERLGNFEVFKE